MRYPIFSLLLLLAAMAGTVHSQESATTASGRKVILHPDGKWEYEKVAQPGKPNSDEVCEEFIETIYDRVTGTSSTSGKNVVVLSNGEARLTIQTARLHSGPDVFVTFRIRGGSNECVDDKSKIYFLFRDGARMEIRNDKFNCDGAIVVILGAHNYTEGEMEMLTSRQIEVIRILTVKGAFEANLSRDQALRLQQEILCLHEFVPPAPRLPLQ